MAKAHPVVGDLSWVTNVAEHGPSLDERHPIWVRHVAVDAGVSISPPHRHAYCEFEMLTQGTIIQHVEREEVRREAGSIFFAGPGVPHWSTVVEYPVEYYVIYFKPWILLGSGFHADAGQLIRRFTARQVLHERVIQPSPPLKQSVLAEMQNMLREFETTEFGRDLKLVSALSGILVDLWRFEHVNGRAATQPRPHVNWHDLELALDYIHRNYAQQIYSRDIATAVRISESGLEALFRDAIGMPWVRYLQRYRIQQAASLLVENRSNVTETAAAVGFSSLSHFNASFRSVMGLPPSKYVKQAESNAAAPAAPAHLVEK